MPFGLNVQNFDKLVDLLYLNKDGCRIVYGIKGAKQNNTMAFFFHLFATKILSFKLVDKKVMSRVITRDDNGNFCIRQFRIGKELSFALKATRRCCGF